jgi:hypothetical protein
LLDHHNEYFLDNQLYLDHNVNNYCDDHQQYHNTWRPRVWRPQRKLRDTLRHRSWSSGDIPSEKDDTAESQLIKDPSILQASSS